MSEPLIVTLYGGPGCGKSTTAALLFGELKQRGFNVEYVHEYAKDLTWEKAWDKLGFQPYVAAKQMWALERLRGQVDIIVTDTSTLLGLIYGQRVTPAFNNWLIDDYKQRNTFNVFLLRNPARIYNPSGRRQSEKSSKAIDLQIRSMLESNGVPFEDYVVSTDGTGYVEDIADEVIDRLPTNKNESPISFYSVKHRVTVMVPRNNVWKKSFERITSKGPQTRYVLQGQAFVKGDKVTMTKFVSKEEYDKL